MENDNSFINLSKGGLCLLFLSSTLCSAFEIKETTTPAEAQHQFISATDLMFDGKSKEAAEILSDLYEKTNSVRVKLEWARAAFLSHQYDLSLKLFNEIQEQNIPESVRFNIGLYVSEISKTTATTDYGFSINKDANPFSMPSSQEIYIYGLPFKYEPPIKSDNLYGVSFYINHSSPILNNSNLRFIGGFDITKYEGINNNKYAGHVAFDYRFESFKNIGLRAGIDSFYQRTDHILDQPYLNFQHRMDYASGPVNTVQIDLRFSKNIYPMALLSSGKSKSLTIMIGKNISSTAQVGGSIYVDDNFAKLNSLSFKTYSTSVFMKKHVQQISSIFQINLMVAHRLYGGIDELFLKNRTDLRKAASVNITKNTKLFGLHPSIEFGVEKFSSNIPVNSYERTFINLHLKKLFN